MVTKVSFKGYVPVSYYAKHPTTDEYVPVLKKPNIRKCNGYIVRNLNGTAKNENINEGFVDFFEAMDEDYENNPIVHSVYDTKKSVVYLVTGDDVDEVKEFARPLGIAKSEAVEKTGKAKSFEVTTAARDYFNNVMNFISKSCKRVTSPSGSPLTLKVFFNPKYNKKQKLTSFEFSHAKFVNQRGQEILYPDFSKEGIEANKEQPSDYKTNQNGQFCINS